MAKLLGCVITKMPYRHLETRTLLPKFIFRPRLRSVPASHRQLHQHVFVAAVVTVKMATHRTTRNGNCITARGNSGLVP